MSRDFGVTDGHSLYSLHRYRSDVRHMVIFDDLVEKEHHRIRLFISEPIYELIRQAEPTVCFGSFTTKKSWRAVPSRIPPGAESTSTNNH